MIAAKYSELENGKLLVKMGCLFASCACERNLVLCSRMYQYH
jgi:hypothetical protein